MRLPNIAGFLFRILAVKCTYLLLWYEYVLINGGFDGWNCKWMAKNDPLIKVSRLNGTFICENTIAHHQKSFIFIHFTLSKGGTFRDKKELFGEPLIKKKFFSFFKWDGGVRLRRLVIFSTIKCLCGIKTLGNF